MTATGGETHAGRSRLSRLWLPAVLIIAVVARLAVMLPRRHQPPHDPDNYLPLARAVADGRGLVWKGRPTAYRPPLYPLMLAPILDRSEPASPRGIFGLHLVLGIGTVAATALAGRRWGLCRLRACVAAAIVACDPVLVVQAAAVMTETLAAFLVAATLAALGDPRPRRAALAGGLGFGIAVLCRPSLLPAAILAACALLVRGPGPLRERLVCSSTLLAALLAILAPWAVRNMRLLGEPVWTTTHGGYTLALANNDVYYDDVLHGPKGAVWSGPHQQAWSDRLSRRFGGLTEPDADRAFRREALRTISDRPADFLRATAARLGRLWSLAPSGAVYPLWLRILTAVWTLPLLIALAAGLARPAAWRWPSIAAVACLLALSGVHALFWTDLRMRAPLVPAIALVAAPGVAIPLRAARLGRAEPT